MSAVTPARADLDAELDAAQGAVARSSASLVDLEAHPGYGLLRAGGFTGVSARRREETLATVTDALHNRARELLWSAPCDPAAATVAVRAYQRAPEEGT